MEAEVDHIDSSLGLDTEEEIESNVEINNENTVEEGTSIEELSSFDISDDDNPLREKLKEMHLENRETVSQGANGDDFSTTSSSRNTSLNLGSVNSGNIMNTPGSVFTVKSHTTRPSSRNTITAEYTLDKIDQKLDHSKAALLVEPNTNATDIDNTDDVLNRKSPVKRLHRVMTHNDHSETDLSFTSDTNIDLNPNVLSKILNSDQIHDNINDRISAGADITRLNKELINCKVQIQLQQEIIRNNLLHKSKEPISDEIIEQLNSLSMKTSKGNLKEKCEDLNKDLNELQNINSVLIDQQEQKQSEYEHWSETVVDILSYLEGFQDSNISDISSETMFNNLGTMLQVVSHKVRAMVNKLKELESPTKSPFYGNEDSVIRSTPTEFSEEFEHDQEGRINDEDISFSSIKTDSLTQLMNESVKQKDNINMLEETLKDRNFKIEKQNEMIVTYKQTINEFVLLLQQTLNGYVNEFIGFHSDFLSISSKIFEHESIEEVLSILRKLVIICDEYQKDGKLINFQNVRNLMNPVWQHNSTVTNLLVEKYQDMGKQNKELKKFKLSNNIANNMEIPKLNEEIKVLKNEINHLNNQLKIAKESKDIKYLNYEDRGVEEDDLTSKLRLETMIKKWKQSEEALSFERRANKVKVRELEDEIRMLKIRR